MHGLTAIVLSYNEEDRIARCLESILWVDEMLVVDSFSTDATASIAQRYGATVLKRVFKYHADQKNWAIPRARHDWILIVDADEWVSEPLKKEIRDLLRSDPPLDGYWIRRENIFLGRKIRFSGWQNDAVLRLFRKDKGKYQDRQVHERLIVSSGRVGRLRHALLHDSYRNIKHYIEKTEIYATAAARDLRRKGVRFSRRHLFFRPVMKFLKTYILRLGFLDGDRGLVISFLGSIGIALRYIKLWEMNISTGDTGFFNKSEHNADVPASRERWQ